MIYFHQIQKNIYIFRKIFQFCFHLKSIDMCSCFKIKRKVFENWVFPTPVLPNSAVKNSKMFHWQPILYIAKKNLTFFWKIQKKKHLCYRQNKRGSQELNIFFEENLPWPFVGVWHHLITDYFSQNRYNTMIYYLVQYESDLFWVFSTWWQKVKTKIFWKHCF